MRKRIKSQKWIVNIAIIAPILIAAVIAVALEIDLHAVPKIVLAGCSIAYLVFVAIVAEIVDRCPYCKKYLGFRFSRRCHSCGKSFY